MSVTRFHLAFPVTDLPSSRAFYTEVLDCRVGRESDRWIDFDFHGHQITCHLVAEALLVLMSTKPCEHKKSQHLL